MSYIDWSANAPKSPPKRCWLWHSWGLEGYAVIHGFDLLMRDAEGIVRVWRCADCGQRQEQYLGRRLMNYRNGGYV